LSLTEKMAGARRVRRVRDEVAALRERRRFSKAAFSPFEVELRDHARLEVDFVLRQGVLADLEVIFATFSIKLQCFFSVSAVVLVKFLHCNFSLASPIENGLRSGILTFRQFLQRLAEVEFDFFVTHFSAQIGRESHEPSGWDILQVSFVNFLLYLAQLFGQAFPAFTSRDKTLLLDCVGFDDPEVLDVELVDTAPVDEGPFGDVQFLSDLSETFAFGAKEDEGLDGLL